MTYLLNITATRWLGSKIQLAALFVCVSSVIALMLTQNIKTIWI